MDAPKADTSILSQFLSWKKFPKKSRKNWVLENIHLYFARSFSPSISSLAAVSSIRVNQEQKRSAEGWKLCNDAMPVFKSLLRDDKLVFNFSYLKFKKFIDYYWI